jgi:hypothetical protein
MMCAIEMGLGGMICLPSFIKIISGIPKLERGDTHTHRKVIS